MNNKIININNTEDNTSQEKLEMIVGMFGDLLTDEAMEKFYRRFRAK